MIELISGEPAAENTDPKPRREPIFGRRVGESKTDAYQRFTRLPIFALGIGLIVGSLLDVMSTRESGYGSGNPLIWVGWAGFALDLVIRWIIDDEPRTFARRHWLLILAVLVPPLRIVLIGYVFVRMVQTPGRLRSRLTSYALYLTVLVISFGSVAVLAAERDYPGSNIHTFGQASWWALVTIATVGYGDFVPVSEAGRWVGAAVILTGLATISIVTASIASRFVGGPVDEPAAGAETDAALPVSLDEINERLIRLERAIAALAAASSGSAGQMSDSPSAATDEVP